MTIKRPGPWLLPSDAAFDTLRIFLLNAIFAMFFLYLGCFSLQPGSFGYEEWAGALVSGTSVAGARALAWRDIGYPLILVIAGFPWTHSFIGLTIITACMGLAMPLLAYFTLRPWFPRAAYWTAMASVLSLAPLIMFKVVHHDQPYIFFMMIALWSFSRYQLRRHPGHLYGLALSVFAMALVRLIGQGMYPPLLLLAWLQARVNLRHVVASAALFAACTLAYSSYREHALGAPPPVLGQQVFWNLYSHLGVGRVALSPDFGPNTKRLIQQVHDALLPSPAQSGAIMDFAGGGATKGPVPTAADAPPTPPEFLENYFYPFTADALTERMFRKPNMEYQSFILEHADDRLLLMTAYEIAMRHPEYIMGYTLQNAFRLLYDPGYTQARFAAYPFVKEGLIFLPSGLIGGYGYNVADAAPEPALTEARFLPLAGQPAFVKDLYFGIESWWRDLYHPASKILFCLMTVTWLSTAIGVAGKAVHAPALARWSGLWLSDRVIAATSGISLLLLLNVGLTALLVDPLYRFAHSAWLLKLMLAGVGGAVLVHLLRSLVPTLAARAARDAPAARPWPQRHMAAAAIVVGMATIAGFGGWVRQMREVATAIPAEGTIHVVSAGGNCGDPGRSVWQHVQSSCSGKRQCDFMFDWRALQDPGLLCRQEFRVEWTCSAGGPKSSRAWAPIPAHRSLLRIACP